MDDRQRFFWELLAGSAFFAFLGAGFGSVVGAITWRGGRAAGTPLGLRVARACGKELSPGAHGAIVGGVDGFVFLGILGLLFGAVGAVNGQPGGAVIHPAGTTLLALALAAIFFGLLASGMLKAGPRAVVSIFASVLLCAYLGASLRGTDGLLPGALLGIVVGTLAALLGGP